ncbi:MAG: IS110 family transposase [Gammaproteobacteria bacterium]|nr:IS110 family transposase [Gammaproteobacteria bacterium]
MKCKTIGIDLAKNVFQVCGVNEHLKPQFNDKIQRKSLLKFMAKKEHTIVVMEACYSSNYWGREITKLGHEVKLIPAQHVTPFVRGNKNDRNDALAIVEASQRPYIRFVPVKTEYQQEINSLHRIRERLIRNRTAIINQIRGLLSEFGVIASAGKAELFKRLSDFIIDPKYTHQLRDMIGDLYSEHFAMSQHIEKIENRLKKFVADSPNGKILLSIPGIGFINASALLATIDKGQAFNNPREFGVWLGLTPQQYASGNTSRMGGITKRGDRYLRKQLIHGARTVVCHAKNKTDQLNQWANKLREKKSFNKTVVAMAHRLARLIWILLQRQEEYRPQYAPVLAGSA